MSTTSTLMLFVRLAVSMCVVLALMVGLAHFARRRGFAPASVSRGGKQLNVQVDVLARRHLARGSSVAVVRTAGKALVLGVTDERVTRLAEVDLDGFDDDADVMQEPPQARNGSNGAQNGNGEVQRTALPGGNQPNPTWKAMLDQLREKTVRH